VASIKVSVALRYRRCEMVLADDLEVFSKLTAKTKFKGTQLSLASTQLQNGTEATDVNVR